MTKKSPVYRTFDDKFSKIIALVLCVCLAIPLVGCAPNIQKEYAYSIKNEKWYQDKNLIASAWRLPVAGTYRSNFVYQENGAFCGPASIVNVFSSLGAMGFSQSSIFDDSSVSYLKARFRGLTLDEVGIIFRDNLNEKGISEWSVKLYRDLTLEEFREHMIQTNSPDRRYVINFNRLPLFGVTVGHHSPIGGYSESDDMVFVLDVLDDYKPFLVPIERLFSAMNTIDNETGKKRGLILLQRSSKNPHQN